jgi:hypothetical protein
MRRLDSIVLFTALGLTAACGGGGSGQDAGDDTPAPDAEIVPAFRNPVDLADPELAMSALQILGANVDGADARCDGCHPLTRQHLRYWGTLSDVSLADCLTDLQVSSVESAHHTIDCFRSKPSNPSAQFDTPKLGVFASAARLEWMRFVFTKAYGGTTEYDAFVARSAMPPGTAPAEQMTQAQFDIVAEWFIRGLPLLDDMLPEDPPPSECFPSVTPRVATHVAAMATEGWRARNAEAGMNMYGCSPGETNPLDCLTSAPLASSTEYGATWDVDGGGVNRVIKTYVDNYATDYWTRSSASGRFIGSGGGQPGFASTMVDLQEGSLININADYDPAFFPDDSGWVFQGGPGGNVCSMSVLTSAGANVTMNEPGCADLGAVGLYEHVGGHPGGDYFSVDGDFVSDNGGNQVTLRDPRAFFGADGAVDITPMVFDGAAFTTKPQVQVAIPYEGDSVLSPSAKLMVSRLSGPGDRQLGFVLRAIDATPSGPSYDIEAPEVARYCFTGGKPAFSYDERWMVIHHYATPTSDADAQELGFTGADDPGWTSTPNAQNSYAARGVANIFLVDLLTGERIRLTHMKPGQYALYPHFRSDGWIYYQVGDLGAAGIEDETEYTVANDAALRLE